MQILSINIGQKRTQRKGAELEITGIYKIPTSGPVHVGKLGLPDDFICDEKNHGGPDQAVFIYGAPDYAWWSEQLGRDLEPGTFGENITLSDFESANCRIGDRLHLGTVILEFTAPRTPCSTLAARMGDPGFVKTYRRAERPGIYCRVIQEGFIQGGDPVALVPYAGPTVSNLEIFREHYRHPPDSEMLRRILQAPVAIRTRAEVERELQKLAR
ncbi:MAG TPA: MOSC domain-containing protein [Anaerolineales bacterium]